MELLSRYKLNGPFCCMVVHDNDPTVAIVRISSIFFLNKPIAHKMENFSNFFLAYSFRILSNKKPDAMPDQWNEIRKQKHIAFKALKKS